MTKGLKPCPMCGNTTIEWTGYPDSRLQCAQCRLGYRAVDYGNDLGLTEACWNRRIGDEP
jgi:hypothetical protein